MIYFTMQGTYLEKNVLRTSHVFGELEEQHFLYHIMSTGFKDFLTAGSTFCICRAVLSFLLGSNEDGLKAPEGLYH